MILVYINPLNKNYKGEMIYEFLFAPNDEINCGDDWDTTPASSGLVTPPPDNEIQKVRVLKTTDIELTLALNSDTFSMMDAVENIIALGWEKESPPSTKRLVFQFGDTLEDVEKMCYSRDKVLEKIKD
jgi:hypothetical protein